MDFSLSQRDTSTEHNFWKKKNLLLLQLPKEKWLKKLI